jgi:hypothetical protein
MTPAEPRASLNLGSGDRPFDGDHNNSSLLLLLSLSFFGKIVPGGRAHCIGLPRGASGRYLKPLFFKSFLIVGSIRAESLRSLLLGYSS